MDSIEKTVSVRAERYLLLIIAAALLLRIWGIEFGLPYLYHFDERQLVENAFRLGQWNCAKVDWNPHFFLWPSFTIYLVFFEQMFYFYLGRLMGIFSSGTDFMMLFFTNPSSFYLLARLTTVFFGTSTVLLLYLLGRKCYGWPVGLLASLFLTLNPLHVENSKYAIPDIPLTFFVVLSYISIYDVYTRGQTKDYILSGLFIGLGISTKYLPVLMIIPLWLAHFLHWRNHKNSRWKLMLDKNILWALLFAGSIFFITSPFCLLDFSSFWQEICWQAETQKQGWLGFENTGTGWYFYLTRSLKEGLGLPLEILSLLGLLYGLSRSLGKHKSFPVQTRESGGKDLVMASFPAIYFLLMGSFAVKMDRYILPIIPLLLLFSARLICQLVNRLRFSQIKRATLISIILLMVLLPPIWGSIKNGYNLSQEDTRTIGKEWIEKNVPAFSKVAYEDSSPPIVTVERANWLLERPEFQDRRDELLDLLSSQPLYRGFQIPWSSEYYDLDVLRDSYDYIIISSNMYDRYKRVPDKYPRQVEFYKRLEAEAKLIKMIESHPIKTPGPTIKIYKANG